jgi:glycyl-tRNA synthetase beta chain
MPELLLELLSEEIPARMQAGAADDLKRLVTEKLKASQLTFTRADAFATPRRLALVIDGLPERQPDLTEEKRGPRVGAPDQAIQGFLKGAGLASLDQAEKRATDRGEFWFAVTRRSGRPTVEFLAAELPALLPAGLPWPKSMRWGSTAARWVRPLQSIVAIFDGKVIAGSIEPGIAFGNRTFGHRFLAPNAFEVKNFADYRDKLRKSYVILDPAERRAQVLEKSRALAASAGYTLKEDDALLDEVAGLVEWPVPLIGTIDTEFMELPPEVLTTVMRTHQRYFTLLQRNGSLAPRFVLVSNMEPASDQVRRTIVAGNERVLRARLSDAKFYWDQDRKRALESRVPALRDMVFHAKLGSLADKVARIQALAAELVPFIPQADIDHVRSAATLAKADLTTGMVGQFPELQGVMGRYYAAAEGEHRDVAEAIAEHYSPLGPNDRCPTAPTSVAVALADKLDSLVGFFAIDERPTGSKDPYALRRAALGIIRLILENRLRLPLREAFQRAQSGYRNLTAPSGGVKALERDLLAFFADRLKVALRDKGVRHDLIGAVFALGDEDDLVRLLARVDALRSFLGTDDGSNLLVAYRRAANIVSIEEKKDKQRHDGLPDPGLLQAPEEKTLFERLNGLEAKFKPVIAAERFDEAMGMLSTLRAPVDSFFDRVTVNTDEKAVRANRLRILSRIRSTMAAVADFSQIEG